MHREQCCKEQLREAGRKAESTNKSKGSRLLSCKGVNQYACYDEKRHNLIRRIDFAWAMEKDENKKQKNSSKVETNDAVTVASMTHPKSLPNEAMFDLAVNMENAKSGCLYIYFYY
ncbi:hypothetical protein DVH24_030457 [Malus domestica]|uniref:Uncharacterized protein n=1 Tax=Malus domestica TaxID=3750 RepID=A0A498JXY5_MALDO|nr:hypothetical protein DVH24_030457 [Malus domestica]